MSEDKNLININPEDLYPISFKLQNLIHEWLKDKIKENSINKSLVEKLVSDKNIEEKFFEILKKIIDDNEILLFTFYDHILKTYQVFPNACFCDRYFQAGKKNDFDNARKLLNNKELKLNKITLTETMLTPGKQSKIIVIRNNSSECNNDSNNNKLVQYETSIGQDIFKPSTDNPAQANLTSEFIENNDQDNFNLSTDAKKLFDDIKQNITINPKTQYEPFDNEEQLKNFITWQRTIFQNNGTIAFIPLPDFNPIGLVIYSNKKVLSNDEIVKLEKDLNFLLLSFFIPILIKENEIQKELVLIASIKSAIAAIMSRNGSHNIGSHVLAAVSNKFNSLPDDQILFEYIQQRMDFIAQVPTGIPQWTQPTWFVKDLMRRFYMQRHLLNYIGRSEGLSAYEFQSKNTNNKQGKILIKITTADGNTTIIDKETKEGEIKKDVQIAIPGGIIGQHAFYTILENFIRNSAKHGWSNNQEGNLEITIDFSENDNFVLFRILDNKSKIKKHKFDSKEIFTHELMNKKIETSFIDTSDGRLRPEDWGIAEMKISTGFLNMKSPEIIGSDKPEDLRLSDDFQNGMIRAFARAENENPIYDGNLNDEKEYYLGYEFIIPKPKELVLIGFNEEELPVKLKNVSRTNPNDLDSEFCIVNYDSSTNKLVELIKNNKEEELTKEIEKYPSRLFLYSQNSKIELPDFKWLKRRICIIDDSNELMNLTEEDLKLLLYKKWLLHLFNNENGEGLLPVKMLINLKGEHGSNDEIIKETFRRFADNIIQSSGIEGKDKEKYSKIINEYLNNKENDKENDKNIFSSLEIFVQKIKEKKDFQKAPFFEVAKDYFNVTKELLVKYEEEIETLPIAFKGRTENSQNTKFEPFDDEIIEKIFNEKEVNDKDKVHISYNRHSLTKYIEKNGYNEAISGAQIYFSILSNFSQLDEYLKQKTLNLLVENAFLKFLIIDERVAQYVLDHNMKDKFEKLNITIPFVIKKENNTSKKDDNDTGLRLIPNIDNKSNTDEIIIKSIEENKYDVVIIHHGILQKLMDKYKYSGTDEIIGEIKEKIPFVYVTSGRGRPAGLPSNAKYFAFSNLETYLLKKYPEKVLLTLILLKIIQES